MDSISLVITKTNIKYRIKYLLRNFCNVKDVGSKNFLKSLKRRLLKDIRISAPLTNLISQPFIELPKWLFHNESSTKYRQVRTVNGYPFDVAKSAIQKYSRRGMPSECMYAMSEMNFFKWLEGGKGSFTNFKNRIRVIFLEDISIASPSAIPITDTLLKKISTSSDPFPNELVQLAWLMSNSLHYRMFSMVRAYFNAHKPTLQTPILGFHLGNDEEFRPIVDSLVYCLENKNLACYWWMSLLVDSKKKLNNKYYRSTKVAFLGFAILEWFFKKQTVHKIIWDNFRVCLEWYKDLKVRENAICPFHPMYMYILSKKLDFDQESYMKDGSIDYFVPNLLNEKKEFIPAVYDMHTSIGRKAGKNSGDFAGEGSLVGFEDMSIDIPLARSTYVNAKIEDGIIWEESRIFKLKARAQLTCSMSRPDVYFADMKGKNVVVKGPYDTYNQANKTFQVSRLLSLFEKINTVPTNIIILNANMFDKVPVGCRRNTVVGKPYYFLVFDDLYDLKEYPKKNKSSKLWHDEPVVDFDKLFKNSDFGFAVPSEMTEEGRLSLLYQLAIRYTFELGDFAARNFTRVGDKVWNLDTEGMFVGKSLRWKKSERVLLAKTYEDHKDEINQVLTGWLNPVGSNVSLYNRWYMIKRVMKLKKKQIKQARSNLKELIKNYKGWLLQ